MKSLFYKCIKAWMTPDTIKNNLSSNNTYHLQGLKTNVIMKPLQFIRNDGTVDSFSKHYALVMAEFDMKLDSETFRLLEYQDAELTRNGARYIISLKRLGVEFKSAVYTIRYESNPIRKVFDMSLQEAEVLNSLDRVDVLEDLIHEHTGKVIEMVGRDPDLIAITGGYLGMIANDMNPGMILFERRKNMAASEAAYELLKG